MRDNFIDSNVFVYVFDETAPAKQAKARQLIEAALRVGDTCISYQVVQETLNVITRKLRVRADEGQANAFLNDVLMPLVDVMPSQNLFAHGIALQARYQLSFYDSLIVAAALEAGCTTLYTEDLQAGLRVDALTVVNPFN
jgi:predicted nucleic acid-binding protein